ncbi:hypothetical protein EMIT053CA3_70252 [Pseudomonas donghuensis]
MLPIIAGLAALPECGGRRKCGFMSQHRPATARLQQDIYRLNGSVAATVYSWTEARHVSCRASESLAIVRV